MNEGILKDKWNLEEIYCDKEAQKPGYVIFDNISYALDLMHKHIVNNSNMIMHTDVDMDGIGSTYIMKRTLMNLRSSNHILMINKDKEHGIKEKHVEYINDNQDKLNIGLLIITDSSSNEIELIKKFNCDVLCIDHHELLHDDTLGYCNDNKHRYVIVNSTIKNHNFDFDKEWLRCKNSSAFNKVEEWDGSNDMSCGLVIYELLRIYCECFSNPKLVENLMLYQWAAITLFTDSINTKNLRNQYYLDQTVFAKNIEQSLKVMMQIVNRYNTTLNKTYINYSFAPLVNKAIRAGASSEALDIIINRPTDIENLRKYSAKQDEAITKATTINGNKRVFDGDAITLNVSTLGIHPVNYNGVIATRLVGDNNKNAAVYSINENGLCRGSFRGRYDDCDYRAFFDNYSEDVYAQGHPAAFGFELKETQLIDIMNNINSIEPKDKKVHLSFGKSIDDANKGVYHIDSVEELRKDGLLLKIAIGNSKVKNTDEIKIRVGLNDVKLKETKGKVFIYDVLGLNCIAYKPLTNNYLDIYAENTDVIKMYIK